ncbi:hypothetical protein [Pseudomonas faucium]|uniref:hypothetical protein n=1 Tax=Pseudomonas faucium TaxID=2740518 RepID=UPI001F31EAF2|nr:hypothetical protein [Pseudomonas faucium]
MDMTPLAAWGAARKPGGASRRHARFIAPFLPIKMPGFARQGEFVMSYGWAEILAHAGAFLATTLVLHTLYWLFCRVKGKAYDGKAIPCS